jgi:steroid 5-alpha reductase family enzyme
MIGTNAILLDGAFFSLSRHPNCWLASKLYCAGHHQILLKPLTSSVAYASMYGEPR